MSIYIYAHAVSWEFDSSVVWLNSRTINQALVLVYSAAQTAKISTKIKSHFIIPGQILIWGKSGNERSHDL
jgi:hypothetical protein